ncbi:hypothetical protein ULMA_30630 [Patiriisocius marinus]|uniref:RiboL-PSP-HEPN domain-containing protein n=1 Tax=Patiriisocius marinus TaxID=1397112 RepID=A0A5J4ISH3_9FLAO|nr:hypothetical protein [Patiriisocius marinus]GER60955.1 hypothetical protein ULMA_30630 [Patiriisocius marinus]
MGKSHIVLKPTKKIKKNFNLSDSLKNIEVPEKSKTVAKEYLKTKKLSDEFSQDLLLEFDDSLIFCFDFLHDRVKYIIPEINPTTILYSNATMFHRNLLFAKVKLFEKSPTLKKIDKPIDLKVFGEFFQYASNCIINLQSSVECFANRRIPKSVLDECIDKNGDIFEPSITHKLDTLLPKVYEKRFRTKSKRDNLKVRQVIELRNQIIHLTPNSDISNTKYKSLYRKLINFEYEKAIYAVRNLINFYEPNLLEDCPCGKEYDYEIITTEKN